MKKLFTRFLALSGLVTLAATQSSLAQVSVSATAGTLGPTAYTNLSSAFTAINGGTHQGAITIDISASFTDAAVSVLNSTGAGSAVYTSVLIRPTSDGVTMSYASAGGRGVIELNGADNVIIDGDNPNTGGINRNLTLVNTASNTTTFTSVVRVALSSLITSGDNNTVKNCIITGSATGRNTAAATSTAGSEGTTYGILVGSGASTASATTAPSAITSVATTISGVTAANFLANNNAIDACARGIAVNGSAATVANNLTVTDNVIGNAVINNTTTVYSRGISVQGFTNAVITGNLIQNIESFLGSTTAPFVFVGGIGTGDISVAGTGATIANNRILGVFNRSTSTYAACGININAGDNHVVSNNFVSNIRQDMSGGFAFGVTYGAYGIRVTAGIGHTIAYNSVNMYGLLAGAANSSLTTAALAIASTASTGMTVRNNILSNTISGGTTSLAHVSLYLPSGATSAMALTLNNNAYYSGTTAASQGIAQAGTTAGTGFYLASNFNAAATSPANNLRSYTSTLSTAGTNDNASRASTVAAPYTSASDLHINTAAPNVTDVSNKGAVIAGITTDIDGATRSAGFPDIGADEFVATTNDAGLVGLAGGSLCPGSSPVILTLANVGSATLTSATINYSVNGVAQPAYSFSGSIAPGGTANVNVGSYTFSSGTNYTIAATSSLPNGVADPDPSNDAFTSATFQTGLTGTLTVGTGGNFTTLTAAVAALNTYGACGPIIFSLTDATYSSSEVFPITINAVASLNATNTLTIKPATGVNATISGAAAGVALIRLNGSDYVTIDGSNNGSTSRNLTITNTSTTTTSTAIGLISLGANAGATYNTIKNCNISTGVVTAASSYGVSIGGTTPGNPGLDNDYNTVQNNAITVATTGIYAIGNASVSATGMDNLTVADNTITTNTTVATYGIRAGNGLNSAISGNTLSITTSGATQPVGISLETGFVSSSVSKNKITQVLTTNTGGYGGRGITVGTGTATSNLTISNNFIAGVNGSNFSGFTNSSSFGIGIGMIGNATTFGTTTGGVNLYYNSVNMAGNYSYAAASLTAALYIGTGVSALDIRDNIFMNSMNNTNGSGTASKNYAFYNAGTAAAFTTINYNDYAVSNPTNPAQAVLAYQTSDRTTLAQVQAATTQDANSQNIVPVFASATDLHLVGASNVALDNLGTPIVGITTDIDNAVRSATTPDMGADEFVVNSNDAGITALVGSGFCAGTQPVVLTLFNYGTANLTSATINWSVNGVAQPAYSFSGSIAPGASANVTVGNYTFVSATNYTIMASSSLPNGAADGNPSNDAFTSATFQTLLSGTYTVGAGGNFTTLTAAVAALNTTGLCGPVVLSLTDATYSGAETFPITINAVASLNATNTLTIKPATGVNATISGAAAGVGLIRLNGSDYVTIDGSNNGSTSRNLTITNTSASTTSAAVGMISLGTNAGATYNTVKNCNLSTGIVAGASYGVAIGGTTPGSAGPDNDYNTVQNNAITVATFGIYAYGNASVSATGMDNLTVANNSITTNTTVATYGMQLGNSLNSAVTGNTVSVLTSGATAPVGISLETGFVSSLVSKNKITQVATTATGGYGGRGITVGTGTATSSLTISNNFIAGVNGSNWTAFTNSSSMGIGIGVLGNSTTLGTTTGGVNLYYNSVNMAGNYAYAGAALTAALYISTGVTALDIRDNIFVNKLNNTDASGTASKNYAFYNAGTATAFTTINFNDYAVSNPANPAQAVLAYQTSDRTTLAALQTATTQDANSKNILPVFVSATDLHLPSGSNVALDNQGTPIVGITTDIDNATRDITTPDMGADEFSVNNNDAGITALVSSGYCPGTQPVVLTLNNYGAAALTSATINYSVNGVAQPAYSFSGSIAPGGSANVTVGNYTFASATNYTITAASSLPNGVADQDPSNDAFTSASFQTGLSGTYTVGTGGSYTTLTAAVAALNLNGICGPVVLSLTDANYSAGETFPLTINALANLNATNTLTIKPASGVNAVITGSSAAAIFKLAGADYVTLDGSNTSGGTTRNLTISNTNTGTSSSVIWLGSVSASNGATNNTVKNCTVTGNAGTTTLAGVMISSGITAGGVAEFANSNNTIQNNAISSAAYGVGIAGYGTSPYDNSNAILQNQIGSTTAANKIGLRAVFASNQTGVTINDNTIFGVTTSTTATSSGVMIVGAQSGGSILRNKISDVKNTNTDGYGANGINLAATSSGIGMTVANNMIFDVSAYGFNWPGEGDNAYGMIVNGGAGYNIWYNTVNMNTAPTLAASFQAAFNVTSNVTASGAINLRNNIFANTATSGTYRFALLSSAAEATVFGGTGAIDYNDYYSPTTLAGRGTLSSSTITTYNTIPAIQTAFTQNTNSFSVAPVFVSATDLHLNVTSNAGIDNKGTYIAAVLTDYDGATRSTTTPDPGADEFVGPPTVVSIAPAAGCPGSSVTITGTNFTGATAVTIGGVAVASFNVVSSTSITAVTVSGNTGTVAVTTAIGTGTSASTYTTYARPTATVSGNTSFCPGGTANVTFTLTGTGPWTLTYSDGVGTTTVPGIASSPYVLAASTAGTYTATALTDANCTATGGDLTGSAVVNALANGTWRGFTSDWNTGTNWCGGLPTASSDVIIPTTGSTPFDPVVLTGNTADVRNITIQAATVTVSSGATMNLYGNVILSPSGTFTTTGATVNLMGAGAQTITPGFTTANLTVAGGSTKTLAGNATVSNNLTFTSGMIDVGGNVLTLSPGATITGAGTNAYVRTSAFGGLARTVGGTSVTFPVGNSTYNPATLTNAGTPDVFTVGVRDQVLTEGTSGGQVNSATTYVVNRTWDVAEAVAGGSNVTMTLTWYPGQTNTPSFDYGNVYIAHYSGSSYDTDPAYPNVYGAPTATGYPGAGPYSATRSGITSFSPFVIGSAGGSTPLHVTLVDVSAANDGDRNKIEWQSEVEDGLNSYVVERSTDGKVFSYLNTVTAMDKAWGYITYDNQPNNGLTYYRLKMLSDDGTFEYSKTVSAYMGRDGEIVVTAQPNPVRDVMTVNIYGADGGAVQLTDVSGRVVAQTSVANSTATFDMHSLAAGAYFVRWSNGSAAKTIKVTKQ